MLKLLALVLLAQTDVAHWSQLKTARATTLYVRTTGSDANSCQTTSRPCLTIESACARIPDDVCNTVTIDVGAGTFGAGCHLVGKRQCAGSNWAAPGQVRIAGALTTSDSGTLTAAAGGSVAACTRDVYTDGGKAWVVDQWKGFLLEITSGTGQSTKRYPISANTATTLTVAGVLPVAAVVGSGYAIKTWGTVINGALPQSFQRPGPVSPSTIVKTTLTAAFVVANNTAYTDSDSDLPFIALEDLQFTTLGSTAAAVYGNGPVAIRECNTTAAGALFSGAPGGAQVSLARNSSSGTGPVAITGNTRIGVTVDLLQLYNNVSTACPAFAGIAGSSVATLFSRYNDLSASACANPAFRLNSVGDFESQCDRLTDLVALRVPNAINDSNGSGQFSFDGLTYVGTASQVYSWNVVGNTQVVIDNAGPASSITTQSHIANLSNGARMSWKSTTTFAGAGGQDFVFSDSITSYTLAALRALTASRLVCDGFSTCVGESGAWSLTTPLVETQGLNPVPTMMQKGTQALTAGAATVTFGVAFSGVPVCTCTDQTAAAAVKCTPSATNLPIAGTGADVVAWICDGAR